MGWAKRAPQVVVLVVLVVLVLAMGSSQVVARLFDVRVLIGLIVMDVVLLGWRLIAVMQAHGYRARPTVRSRSAWVTGLLVALVVATHALPAYYAAKAIDTLDAVALGGRDPDLRDSF